MVINNKDASMFYLIMDCVFLVDISVVVQLYTYSPLVFIDASLPDSHHMEFITPFRCSEGGLILRIIDELRAGRGWIVIFTQPNTRSCTSPLIAVHLQQGAFQRCHMCQR
jgi:hypothetical protein